MPRLPYTSGQWRVLSTKPQTPPPYSSLAVLRSCRTVRCNLPTCLRPASCDNHHHGRPPVQRPIHHPYQVSTPGQPLHTTSLSALLCSTAAHPALARATVTCICTAADSAGSTVPQPGRGPVAMGAGSFTPPAAPTHHEAASHTHLPLSHPFPRAWPMSCRFSGTPGVQANTV